MSKKVNVLVAVYNGEKYLREQLDSVLAQTYPDIEIYIRDDGSTDGSKNILKEYEKYRNVHVIYGENIGFSQNFLSLLKIASDGDYWAFCDQDDYWFPEKVEKSVAWLKLQDEQKPQMYSCAYYNTDEYLQNKSLRLKPSYRYDFPQKITHIIHRGFSTTFNKVARQMALRSDFKGIPSHDHWIEYITFVFGNIYDATEPLAYHRRHFDAFGYDTKHHFRYLKRTIETLDTFNHIITDTAKEFYEVFHDELDEKDRKLLKCFLIDRYSFKNSLRKAFFPQRWIPNSWKTEIFTRVCMLIGKV